MPDLAHLNAVAVCACLALIAWAAKQAVIALRLLYGADDEEN
jgi:hypothetical protein